ncbi:hypothetical protein HU720_21640 [Pseudomonas sp. SWRI51]|uniref:hypothetical protein n=1 Tax=Pseudomonas sp. SWRI51 TaxID=2745491 RepID=UPI0016447755|nr:hypothetical protein [Pseudomonas sp. SWRI51]MBC3413903.1 hypothetical protein [Pseudomonas sp. SWRI51]
MPENYGQASVRHYIDAEALASSQRFDGAGHLIGFSAECAIKHHIQTILPGQDAPHSHFPNLIDIAKRHLHQRRQTNMHQILKKQDLMLGWDIAQRYSPDGSTTAEIYEIWRSQASHMIFAAGLRR